MAEMQQGHAGRRAEASTKLAAARTSFRNAQGRPQRRGHGDAAEVARTQSLFREVNEQLERVATKFGIDRNLDFVCECGSHACTEHVELALSEYEAVRTIPTRFVVKPGHVRPTLERTVEEHGRYAVVEKTGDGGVVAVRFDPRRRPRLAAVSSDLA